MAKGGVGRESYQPQVTWMEQKAQYRSKGGGRGLTARRRRASRRTSSKKLLLDNVVSSGREGMMCRGDGDPFLIRASSTGYSTDAFEREEEEFIKDLERPRFSCKSGNHVKPMAHESSSGGARGAPFVFQKRLARIDWRSLHAIDVDRLMREVDIDTLESVLDTVAFGDIRGEDAYNFTEDNFVKIFRLAQLMVEYLLHVQELLADHKSELLQTRATLQQKNEKIRSRFLWQRDALLQTRHELRQAKKTLQTYEVMLKVQGENQAIQACQSNKQQVRHCSFCEKVFESPYYLDLHVARKHQQKQEVTEDKIFTMVSRAEEGTAARVKEEMSLAVQKEIQQLHKRYQADFRRTESSSDAQVRTLQEDLQRSNNRLHAVQTRLEVLQAQILPATSNNAWLGSSCALEKSMDNDNGPNQERLYELESKFSGLEHRVKTLGQDNSRLLEELNEAYAKVSDLQFAKRQSVFALETKVDDLRKENRQLKRAVTKVCNLAEAMGDKPSKLNLETYNQSLNNPTVDPFLIFNSRIHSSIPPKSSQPEVPKGSFDVQEDTANFNPSIHIHKIPSPILEIIEAKEPVIQACDVLDFQKLDNTTQLSLIEEPVALTPRERWTREPDKDQALLALARPTSARRTEETSLHSNDKPNEQESSAKPERSRNSTSAGKREPCLVSQGTKYETSSERMRKLYKERPTSVAVRKSKSRGDESPPTAEELYAKLEREMNVLHEEQKRRRKAVRQLLVKELAKEKVEAKKKGILTNTRSCKPGTPSSHPSKSETSREDIAPLILALRKKDESSPSSSTIHTVREIVSNRAESSRTESNRPKPGPVGRTWTQSFRSPRPSYQPGPGCKKSLPAVHPYLRPGLGKPQTQPQTSLHMAVLNSNPALQRVTHNHLPNKTVAPSREHIIERLGAVTQELEKYFPPKKPSVEKSKYGTVKPVQPILKLEFETTETNETEEDDAEKYITSHEDEKTHRQQVAKVAAIDVEEVKPAMSIPERQSWPSEHPSAPIPAMSHVATKYPHPETDFEEPHQDTANGQLCEELKKFGITSNTNGISDTTYNSISSALEMQRLLRMSQAHGKDRNTLEYERGAIVWHTERAVRDRDTKIIEAQFDVATDSGSDHLSDANGSENSADEFDRRNYSSTIGHQSHKVDKSNSESRKDELKPGRANQTRSRERSTPKSSELSRSSDSLQEAESNYNNQIVTKAKHLNSSKVDGMKYSNPKSRSGEGQVHHVSRAISSKPTRRKGKSSRNNEERPPSRGEVVSSTEFVDNRWQPEDDEVEEELEFGLGDWDSDHDAASPRGK